MDSSALEIAGGGAVVNLVLVGIPLAIYLAVQRLRHKTPFHVLFERIGFAKPSGMAWSALALTAVAIAWVSFRYFTTPLERLANDGSPLLPYVTAPTDVASITAATLYGFVQTGFCEELLFRGMITGALARRMPLWKANTIQTALFTGMHLPILFFVPEQWFLVLVMPTFFGLAAGWLRVRSGSILWPWLLHGSSNFVLAILVLLGPK